MKLKVDPLFKDLSSTLPVFQWHEDTFTLPEEGELLVEGVDCKNQAFRIGECAWGLQFHPEMNLKLIKSWLEYYKVNLDKNEMFYGYYKVQETYLKQIKIICSNFTKITTQKKESFQSQAATTS